MLPSELHTTGKRKAIDENPLLNAAKKQKKDHAKSGASNKRKLLNGEEQPGGLLIVRGTTPKPPSTDDVTTANAHAQNPLERPLSRPPPPRPPSAGPSAQPPPPSKKFRADPRGTTKSKSGRDVSQEDPTIDRDVRAMEDEADYLRRNSRATTTADSPVSIPPRSADKSVVNGKKRVVDTTQLLPETESPMIARNKQMRKPSLNAIRNVPSDASGSESSGSGQGHRRRSSSTGRGKRASDVFSATGVITQPHASVAESAFSKHIDLDLPDAERIRQLLIWCSFRATAAPSSSPPPPLSPSAAEKLAAIQKDVIRMLADKEIDLSFQSLHNKGVSPAVKKENEQNVSNRRWEVDYGDQIKRAEKEDEAWKKVSYFYDTYLTRENGKLDKRMQELRIEDDDGHSPPSAKAKGKQKATTTDHVEPDDSWLPRTQSEGVRLAKSVLGIRPHPDERVPGGRVGTEKEEEIKRRLADVEFTLDMLAQHVNAAKTTTSVAETALDQRFGVLARALEARYMLPPRNQQPQGRLIPVQPREDPQDLLRALARIDSARPPQQVGDAARRAAREVQRAEESGAVPIGERRLTFAPPPTPQRPRTPSRRAGTPGRK